MERDGKFTVDHKRKDMRNALKELLNSADFLQWYLNDYPKAIDFNIAELERWWHKADLQLRRLMYYYKRTKTKK